MLKKSKKSADLKNTSSKKPKTTRKHPPKKDINPLRELQEYLDAQREERRRNPPKTDYVLPNGKMLPVPVKRLASDQDVADMYEHLYGFCGNSITHSTGHIYRDHDHPLDCLAFMWRNNCISIGELRQILLLPLQVRLLHEHLYRLELLDIFPYRQFIVEFVEMLRFMLRMHGYTIPEKQRTRRYCYCWCSYELPPGKKPYPKDFLAESYEVGLLKNKVFLKEWDKLRLSVPVSKWVYCKYQGWFLAFDNNAELDFALAQTAIDGWKSESDETGCQDEGAEENGLKPAVSAFCQKWSLTHLGTPVNDLGIECPVILRAERVEVFPQPDQLSPVPNTRSPTGFAINLPKYYGFSHISRYRKDDFIHLKYAFDLAKGNRQRKGNTVLPDSQKKRLLKSLRDILEKGKLSKDVIFRILKGVSSPIADATLHGLGFDVPEISSKYTMPNGEVVPMDMPDAFAVVMMATAKQQDDQRIGQKIFSKFGFDVDLCLQNMPCNKA